METSPQQEQPQAEQSPEPEQQAKPVCPHCGDDPLRISSTLAQFGNGQVVEIMFCGNPDCRKVFSGHTLNANFGGAQMPLPPHARIVGPNGLPPTPALFRK